MAFYKKSLTLNTINPNIKKMEFLVMSDVFKRALEIEKELKQSQKKSFQQVVYANKGDCHAMGQQPITLTRQVLALVMYPELFDNPSFPEDAKSRARNILNGCQGQSVGSYSPSPGIEIIRRHVAQYIERRDGHPSDWQNVILSSGAIEAMKNFMTLFVCDVNGQKPGVMVPIPQYPLFSALIAEFNMHQINYYLNEEEGWAFDMNQLERSIGDAKKVCNPRAIVIINPGNPTGQVLSLQNIEEVIRFAYKENLVILADEVYQENIYAEESKFYSCKKVLMEMGPPYNAMELASFMSCSTSYLGECGLRSGYAEVINLDPEVKAVYNNSIINLTSPPVTGQTALDVVVNPPQKDEPSYEKFMQEKNKILETHKLNAKMIEETFNSLEWFTCNPVQGAMYAFPQIKLPLRAIDAAEKEGKHPDEFYAFKLLESTGICIVPGSGFGQKPGTYHFRTTILPQTDALKNMLQIFKTFHEQFVKEFA